MNETFIFYGWWQFATCFFGFLALMSIWWHIGRKQNDLGQVWLAFSILCWSLSGLVEVYYADKLQENKVLVDGYRSILSLCNSLFILLALPWFRYLPKMIESLIKSRYWIYIVGLPFVFSVLPTLNKMFLKGVGTINELDVYYAVLTLLFLGLVLWESFAKRRLKSLAVLSLVCVLITLVAQIYKLTGSAINLQLFSAIFKTSLIMIFFALALSWVKELSENIIPSASQLYLSFKVDRKDDKLSRRVFFRGFPGATVRQVELTASSYDLLYRFAELKKNEEGGWLEIKPKKTPAVHKSYDIKDYNEIKRLLVVLLDGIFGKGNWTSELHLIPMKNALLEASKEHKRKIRLSLPAENITL